SNAMSVSAKSIAEELKVFDVNFEDEEVPEKMVELCTVHRLKEEDMVNEWMAFSTTRNLPLTVGNLNLLEHEVLNKKSARPRPSLKKEKHCGNRDFNTIQELIEVETAEENLLDSYATPAKGSQKRNLSTPEHPQSKRILSINRSPHVLFSPTSFSPSATPSQKYGSRTNRGEVVTTYGELQGTTWNGGSGSNTNVELFTSLDEPLTKMYKFMFQKLMDIREVVSIKIEELGASLKDHFQIDEFTSVSLPAQETVTVLGQIGCDSNGKLNSKSVILEGDREHSAGMQVPVDLSELKDYSLFPGQVVIMEGTNSTGRRFVPTKLYEGVPLPFHQPSKEFEECPQQMVITACGPFTTSDTITYDALKDLIDIVNRDRPDICILLGPFLDAKHEQIENLQLTVTFEDVFKRCLKMIIEGTRPSGCHLVIVPSLRDVHHDPVYPQPPFSCFEPAKEDKERVHFVADPCTLSVNGVVIGMTSTDLLFHMGAEEISSSAGAPDRFSRILRHILTQRSYYPLYPPNEEINIDYEALYSYTPMPVTPDVFIVPSELRYFIKDVTGCICINPGRLTKGLVGGTYARFLVKSGAMGSEGKRSTCISAQVVRV
nr:Chain B, DNA polymerase alpha subunit B [Xenopus laevis]8G9F_B Chain B, DNA polymerase alpha subunit B [Xenopus laevis]8V5M_B Chain B, DNA polymerase alpha subunit B [Xenopus laevis]8V5N_B Chain B, DNA polymerase alpha subunit B [Xenopus laevis]8V5O_B Chain B, DNA polymerase alpha subunit B [Xenopus laevis]8V6G_B Chain B, DNA polymerase alpha subunit B [Xenopus laevis]8V6H_B Chain B, DNA polymerase alpha subunit B [Xenopus laevis]8V6I_B Chain B, DNA polymerase alpha subunit B [Xenopus lae